MENQWLFHVTLVLLLGVGTLAKGASIPQRQSPGVPSKSQPDASDKDSWKISKLVARENEKQEYNYNPNFDAVPDIPENEEEYYETEYYDDQLDEADPVLQEVKKIENKRVKRQFGFFRRNNGGNRFRGSVPSRPQNPPPARPSSPQSTGPSNTNNRFWYFLE